MRRTGSRPSMARAGSRHCAFYSSVDQFFNKTWRPGDIEEVE
jgi:hypothetical protein